MISGNQRINDQRPSTWIAVSTLRPCLPELCTYNFCFDAQHATTLNSTAKDLNLNHPKSPRNGPVGNCTNWILNWFHTKPEVGSNCTDWVNPGDSLLTLWSRECEISGFGTQLSWLKILGWNLSAIQSCDFLREIMGISSKLYTCFHHRNPKIGFESHRLCIFVALCNTSNPTKRYKRSPKSKVLELLQFERKAPDSAMSKLSARSGWRTRKSLCCSTNSFRRRIGGQVGSPWQI